MWLHDFDMGFNSRSSLALWCLLGVTGGFCMGFYGVAIRFDSVVLCFGRLEGAEGVGLKMF